MLVHLGLAALFRGRREAEVSRRRARVQLLPRLNVSFPGWELGSSDPLLAAATTIEQDVGVSRHMPHALRTYDRFWHSTSSHARSVLDDAMTGRPDWSDLGCPN